jgi:hypothetical protein
MLRAVLGGDRRQLMAKASNSRPLTGAERAIAASALRFGGALQ